MWRTSPSAVSKLSLIRHNYCTRPHPTCPFPPTAKNSWSLALRIVVSHVLAPRTRQRCILLLSSAALSSCVNVRKHRLSRCRTMPRGGGHLLQIIFIEADYATQFATMSTDDFLHRLLPVLAVGHLHPPLVATLLVRARRGLRDVMLSILTCVPHGLLTVRDSTPRLSPSRRSGFLTTPLPVCAMFENNFRLLWTLRKTCRSA